MRSVPVVKKALIVFHQCCMRSAATAAAAVAPIVSSFCLFSAKKRRAFESSWHFEAKISCCLGGRCDDSWAGWCCEEENTLSFLFQDWKKKITVALSREKVSHHVLIHNSYMKMRKFCSTMQHLYERISLAGQREG